MTREDQAAENRRKFPEIAELVDRFRATGATVKLLWAQNDQGDEIGKRREWGSEE